MAGKAMDKLYKFDESGNLVEVLVPTGIGFIGLYAGPEPPEGYLYCDGSAIGRETYSELFEAVGTLYGAGDGVSTFELPDARGIFFRGDGGENNAAMGVRQGDAIRNITGNITKNVSSPSMGMLVGTTEMFSMSGALSLVSARLFVPVRDDSEEENSVREINFDASATGIPTAAENRPINLAMKPCIRYV